MAGEMWSNILGRLRAAEAGDLRDAEQQAREAEQAAQAAESALRDGTSTLNPGELEQVEQGSRFARLRIEGIRSRHGRELAAARQQKVAELADEARQLISEDSEHAQKVAVAQRAVSEALDALVSLTSDREAAVEVLRREVGAVLPSDVNAEMGSAFTFSRAHADALPTSLRVDGAEVVVKSTAVAVLEVVQPHLPGELGQQAHKVLHPFRTWGDVS